MSNSPSKGDNNEEKKGESEERKNLNLSEIGEKLCEVNQTVVLSSTDVLMNSVPGSNVTRRTPQIPSIITESISVENRESSSSSSSSSSSLSVSSMEDITASPITLPIIRGVSTRTRGPQPEINNKGPYHWTPSENARLLKAMRITRNITRPSGIRNKGFWQDIAKQVGNKNDRQCKSHWQKVHDIRHMRGSEDRNRMISSLDTHARTITHNLLSAHHLRDWEAAQMLNDLLTSLRAHNSTAA